MLERILMPVDGSSLAECVLPHVITFAQVFNSNVTLLHVMDPGYSNAWDMTVDPLSWQIKKSEVNAYLNALVLNLQSKGINVQAVLLEGRPAEHILDFAQKDQTSLIALSSHGHGGLSDWSLGSTTQKLLARAHGAKLIVRAAPQTVHTPFDQITAAKYQRVFAPLDGSWRAECVLPLVTKLAQTCDAEVISAHIIRKPEMARRTPLTDEDIQLVTRVEERNRLETAAYFEQLRTRLPMLTETRILSGESAAVSLHEYAERAKADLVILSAHGFTGEMKWPYGSVAQSFLWDSRIPIFLFDDSSPCQPMLENDVAVGVRQHEVPAHA